MNEVIRKELLDFVERNGVKLVHVAKCIGVDSSYITHFLKGRTNMSTENLNKILVYIGDGSIQ